MQVKNLGLFINPVDKPKNAFDLSNKIGVNQGIIAYYRGTNALIYKLIVQHSMKFFLYETVFQQLGAQSTENTYFLNTVAAASLTALVTTTVTYPLDMAHGRMAADMSKKPSIFNDNKQKQNKNKLYSSVRDCITKAQMETGLSRGNKIQNMFRGYQSAIIAQVPYTVIMMGSFEAFHNLSESQDSKFNSRKDGLSFIYKFLTRFGPSTMSLLIAQTLCYPLDTIKRRMQLNGSLGHKNLYKSDLDCFKKILKDEGLVKGFYAGFSVNLVRCVPMTLIQYIMFKAFRKISQKQNEELYSGTDSGGNTPLSYPDLRQRFSEPAQMTRDDSQAIPFIKFIQSEGIQFVFQMLLGRFEMNPEAEEFLLSLKDIKLGVVAVCGKYRTGKSYLLNKLFVETYFQNLNNTTNTGGNTARTKDTSEQEDTAHLNNTTGGFIVSPTINPCTKGLWIWKKVIYSDQNDCPMIVIDTEGLGAFDEDENHDAKIFLLALLLSSLIIYNSVGTIDENALNNLSLVINLSKQIQLRNRQETPEDIDELASIFPSFLWVLRDFTLKLVDSEGNRISSRQYLENALKEQKGCSESAEQKNRVRRLLKHFFQDRDCCTLIRPTEKEKDLQDLTKMKDSNLRKDFIEQMGRLKQKVMTKVKVKVINGHQLNGPMIVELALSYINALNNGQVPNIENAWQNVCSFEQERAFKDSIKYFEQEVKEKVRNTYEDIGYGNVKNVLNQIKEASLKYLKSKFLGDAQSIADFEKKLKAEIKQKNKIIIKEIQYKIDEQINKCVVSVFQQQVEDKVRRDNEDLNTLEKVHSEIDHALTVVQIKFVNDSERVEYLYRKYIQQRLFKVIEILNDNEKRQQQIQTRLMEERLKMNEQVIQQQKDERRTFFEDTQNQKDRIELERSELIRNEKLMEQKFKQLEFKLTETSSQLKMYQNKDYRDQMVQTQKKMDADYYVQVLNENDYQISEDNYLNRSVNTSYFNYNDDKLQNIPDNELLDKLPFTVNQLEQNRRLYNDILDALNNQSKQISQTMSEEFGQILKNNQSLSKAIEQSEKRCLILERKLDKKGKYESLVKHCQRLQCNGCSKLYTPMLFVSHYLLCKKQQNLRSSIINDQQNQGIQEEEKEDSQSVIEQQFLAKIVDMKQVYIDLRDGCISQDEYCINEITSNSDELVTIMGCGNIGRLPLNMQLNQQQQQYCSVQFKFCILFKGSIWYIHRSLQQIKNVMNKIQRDKDNTECEQCQIAKWLLEIERNEIEENYQRISEIIEIFFQMQHRKIIENQLSMTMKVDIHADVEDLDDQRSKHGFFQEFMEFFEITANINGENNWNHQGLHTNDDEVIVQMTYDENDDMKTESGELNMMAPDRSSAIGATIQSAISELCGTGRGQRLQGYCLTGSAQGCNNHSTIQLDGEKSVNENSSLHFVSFFSVAEELLMKKNLLEEGRQSVLSQNKSSGQTYNDGYEVHTINDENFMAGSPEKMDRRNKKLQQQPFCSLSNRPSTANIVTQNEYRNSSKTKLIEQKSNVLFRQSQSPFSSKTLNGKSNSAIKSAKKNNCGNKVKNNATSAKKYKNGNIYTE